MMLLPLTRMHPLMVYNSLTRTKVRFIPRDPKSITWYQCGPTVYAESHVGHARTYVTLDILVRIMREFLGYNVILCQNVSKCYLSGSWFVRCSTRPPDNHLRPLIALLYADDMVLPPSSCIDCLPPHAFPMHHLLTGLSSTR